MLLEILPGIKADSAQLYLLLEVLKGSCKHKDSITAFDTLWAMKALRRTKVAAFLMNGKNIISTLVE